MFEALANNRKSPTEKDIQKAFNRTVKDKNALSGGSVNLDKYIK
jgi:hypothetical protein